MGNFLKFSIFEKDEEEKKKNINLFEAKKNKLYIFIYQWIRLFQRQKFKQASLPSLPLPSFPKFAFLLKNPSPTSPILSGELCNLRDGKHEEKLLKKCYATI